MSSILLTRPKLEALKTRRTLTRLGFRVFIESMFFVRYLPVKIDFNKFDVIISTSKNSVIALRKIIKKCHCKIITVGDGTMQTAKKLGFNDVMSLSGTIHNLVNYIRIQYNTNIKILYIRGEKITYDVQKNMSDFLNIEDIVLYKTIERNKLSRKCYNILANDDDLRVIFYSAYTAEIFIKLVEKYNFINKLSNITA